MHCGLFMSKLGYSHTRMTSFSTAMNQDFVIKWKTEDLRMKKTVQKLCKQYKSYVCIKPLGKRHKTPDDNEYLIFCTTVREERVYDPCILWATRWVFNVIYESRKLPGMNPDRKCQEQHSYHVMNNIFICFYLVMYQSGELLKCFCQIDTHASALSCRTMITYTHPRDPNE